MIYKAVSRTFLLGSALLAAAVALSIPAPGRAAEPDCISCHEDLTAGTSVHAAVQMGCVVCHSGVDATEVPHSFTTRNPKGLGSKLRDICFDCHDRNNFMKKNVHPAVMLGCNSCHNPHRADRARLLIDDMPALCITCHQERFTPGKDGSHALAGNEACASCHDPHASDAPSLMLTERPGSLMSRTAHVR